MTFSEKPDGTQETGRPTDPDKSSGKKGTEMIEAALAYSRAGFPVFPCAQGGKTPAVEHGYFSASTDTEQLKLWFGAPRYNLAISTGAAGLLVLDIDPRHGGEKSFEALVANHGALPNTPQVSTPQGGRHYYFRASGPSLIGILPGIDTRGNGGYVLAPPSRTEHGAYEWDGLEFDLHRIAPAPDWLLELLQDKRREQQKAPVPQLFKDGERNTNMLRILGKARRAGMLAPELVAFAESINKSRCETPLDDNELAKIVASSESYRSKDPQSNGGLSWFSSADLRAASVMPPNVLVENILPSRSLVLASAAPKAGKSTFSVSLCHALATGSQFLGRLETKRSKVLYWIPDDPNIERFARTWRDCAGNTNVPNFSVSTGRVGLPEAFDVIEENITQHSAQVCVIDSYTTIRPATGGDFVQREYDDLRRFSEIAGRTACSIILIHHHSKTASSKDDTFLSAAGSFAMSAACDAMWSFIRLENNERKLSIRGRDIEEYALIYKRDTERKLRFLVDGDGAEYWQELREAVEHGLTARFDRKALAESLGQSARTANRAIKRWSFAGLVKGVLNEYEIEGEIQVALGLKDQRNLSL